MSEQAAAVWAIVAPALQAGGGGHDLMIRSYRALQTGAMEELPDDVWHTILAWLPLEDLARLAQVDKHVRALVERRVPQALDPAAHEAPDFVRTIYTQAELDAAPDGVVFAPGAGRDLTLRHNGTAVLHGPGTLTAIDDGWVYPVDDARILTVTGGHVMASGQAVIDAVTGGEVDAGDDVRIGTVTADAQVDAFGRATIGTVTGGRVNAHTDARIGHVAGGSVEASLRAAIGTVTGGNITLRNYATIDSVTGGDTRIRAYENTQVTVHACADQVHVDAYDCATITADSGTVTVRSPGVTVNVNGNVVVNHQHEPVPDNDDLW
ncbi:F-box protein [Streptomyces erythrochromogenes]|uniref:F-box protein n=1 Tax=Streptomyces erythrochromogenes TaxID=285574 RepID=UPI003421DAF9